MTLWIGAYWGKAQPVPRAGYDWHPLAYHCLDVAAAADALLRARPRLAARLSEISGLSIQTAEGWLRLLLGLHDLGKFADCFQSLVPERWHLDNKAIWTKKNSGPLSLRHGDAGLVLWCEGIGDTVSQAAGWSGEERGAFESWLLPVFGHHGKPILNDGNLPRARDIATTQAISDATAYAVQAVELLLRTEPRKEPAYTNEQALLRAGWLVAGFAVMADWIGSNQEWFPYHPPILNLPEYLEKAKQQAAIAVSGAGLVSVHLSYNYALPQALNLTTAEATPLQDWAATVALLEEGPCLAFLEDLTGSGKTEAALILAFRMMARGKAGGLYWALPTQATANALYTRLSQSYKNLFEQGATPSLALAHSSTDLQNDYQNSFFREGLKENAGRPEEKAYSADEETASALCAAWLASDRRRSLLADVGVGTIDQALMGALPVKFQSLRLTALADRILVVDEAHSYDAFTTRLLKQTLAFQAALGGSAIVLSATLTSKTKNELLTAFAEGAGWVRRNRNEKAESGTNAFPLASLLCKPQTKAACAPQESPLSPLRGTRRDLKVKRHDSAQAAIASLIEHARAGRCAVWIRNTVQDALDGAGEIAKAAPDIQPRLFHARFTLADRAAIETQVLHWFGKQSTAELRAPEGLGRVVVTTQVVEQSLDLDFDAMVTDLAPIDLLIQRAGRLHRHSRGGRSEPVLEIVSPPPIEDAPATWYSAVFPRASYVYPHPGHLWRTMKVLEDVSALRLASQNPRELLHEVFDGAFPEKLQKPADEALGKSMSWQALAAAQVLDWRDGYVLNRGWESEAEISTRLGEATRTVRLAKWHDGKLIPWVDGEVDEKRAWRMSEIQLRAAKAIGRGKHSPEIEKAASAIESTWAGRAATALLLPLVFQNEEWAGSLLGKGMAVISAKYNAMQGFRFLA